MTFIQSLRDLYHHRRFFLRFTLLQLHLRYKVAVLGFLWSLLRPLFLALVLFMVFSQFFRFQLPSGVHYGTYIVASMLPWAFFSSGMFDGVGSLLANSNLFQKVALPLEAFPLSAVAANLFNFVLSLAVVLPILAIFGGLHFGWGWLVLIPVALQIVILVGGLCCITSVLHVFYRDVGMILEVVMTAWFYLTPIFYPPTLVLQGMSGGAVDRLIAWVFLANPMYSIVALYRHGLFGGVLGADPNWPEFSLRLWLPSLLFSLFVFWLGITLVRKKRTEIIDFL